MVKINSEEQRARFEVILENMDPEDYQITANWGGELYRDGIIAGSIFGAGVTLIGIGLYKAISWIKVKGVKESGCN